MAATTATAASATATPSSWRDSSTDSNGSGGLIASATSPQRSSEVVAPLSAPVEIPSPGTQSYVNVRDCGISQKQQEFSSSPPDVATKDVPADAPEQNATGTTIGAQASVASADEQNVAAPATAAMPPPPSAAPDDVVDSALQAALREPRERMALLRLESLLVDFCRSESAGWLEVSGLYNATWIGPQLAGRSSQQGVQNNINSGGGAAAYGSSSSSVAAPAGVVPPPPPPQPSFGPYGYGPSVAMMQQQLPPYLQQQQPPPRPATSFQRCVLHRLADRFGIIRETGSVMEGSIRLIKVPETKIPPKLLQDMDPSEYALEAVTAAMAQANMGDSRYAQTAVSAASNSDGALPQTAQSPIPAAASAGAAPPQQPRSSRKMKIMKRSESSRSRSSTPSHHNASGSARGDSGAAGGTRNSLGPGTDLTERERAYAEARARIFRNHDDASGNADDTTNGEGENSIDFVSGNPSTAAQLDYEDESTGPVSTPALAFAAAAAASAAASNQRSPLKSAPINPNDAAVNGGVDPSAAAMPTTENKATYRNRLEEAADPDFKRGVVVTAVQQPVHAPPYSYAASTNPGVPAGAIPFAQHHYQPHVVTTAGSPEYLTYAPALITGCYPYGPYAPAASTGPAVPAASHFPALHSTVTAPPAAAPRAANTATTGSSSVVRTSLPKLAANAPAFYPSWASAAAAASSKATGPDPPAASQR